MRIILICISFFVLSVQSFAQEQFIEPAKFITRFPFKMFSGGVMLVKARINNYPDTLNFILDTGSGAISLDSSTCQSLGITHVPSGRTLHGIAGRREVNHATGKDLHLPGLTIPALDFYVNDYEILSQVYGEKIDGIIGHSFFSKFIVKINFDSLIINVFSQGEVSYPRGGHLLKPFFTTLPIQTIRVKDERTLFSSFYFDTGAGLCFLMSSEFVKDSAILQKKRKPVMVQAEGLGGKKKMQLTIIKELKLGPFNFRKVPSYILDDEFNALSYPYLGGLIGNDILRRFNLIVNYGKKEIHLIPNTHYNTPFDYSYTGLSIYNVEGRIIVDDVIAGSPAAKAGFQKDDLILSVNNNISNDIQVYKGLLQASGQQVKAIVMRDGQPNMITMRVGRIY